MTIQRSNRAFWGGTAAVTLMAALAYTAAPATAQTVIQPGNQTVADTTGQFALPDIASLGLPNPPANYYYEVRGLDSRLALRLEPGKNSGVLPFTLEKDKTYRWEYLLRENNANETIVRRFGPFGITVQAMDASVFINIQPADKPAEPLDFSNVLFRWNRLPGATAYTLVLGKSAGDPEAKKVNVKGNSLVNPTEDVTDPNTGVVTTVERAPFKSVSGLDPDTIYFWHVTSTVNGITYESPETSFRTTGSKLQKWKSMGYTLQRSQTVDQSQGVQPALLGFKNTLTDPGTLNTEFFLSRNRWHSADVPATERSRTYRSSLSVETKLTSAGKNRASDFIKLRYANDLAIGSRAVPAAGSAREAYEFSNGGYYLGRAFKYELDGKAKTQKLTAELTYTPNVGSIGFFRPFNRADPETRYTGQARIVPGIQSRYRPYIGLDFGRRIDGESTRETHRNLLRVPLRLVYDVRFNQLARQLDLKDVLLTVDNTYRFLPLEDDKHHDIFNVGLSFYPEDNLALSLSYKLGQDSPNFTKTQEYGLGLGVKF